MAGITITQLQSELGAYNRKNNRAVVPFVYNGQSQLSKYAKKVSQVNGEFPVSTSVTGHVVQAFRAQWDAMGETRFKANILKAFRQKVNFPITPNDIYPSWLGDLYTEGMKPADMPISKYIIEKELGPAVKRDLGILEITGVYSAGDQSFGVSMNGIQKVIADGIADTDNPMVRNVINPITESNVVDEIKKFEKYIINKLPVIAPMITKIYMSRNNSVRYKEKYEQTYGTNMDYAPSGALKTKLLGLEIVPLDYASDSLIFCTPDGNLLKLIDAIEEPRITDVQALDYTVKVFMDFTLGFNFAYNQMVIAATYSGNSGLATDHEQYYPA